MLIFSFVFVLLPIVIAVVAFCIGKQPLLLNVGMTLGVLAWITGFNIHSSDKQSIKEKCKIAYELDAAGKRELATEIVQHNNGSDFFYFGSLKIDPEKYPDLVPDIEIVSNKINEEGGMKKLIIVLLVSLGLGVLIAIVCGSIDMLFLYKRAIEAKCETMYKRDAKGKRNLAKIIIHHNNVAKFFFCRSLKIDPKNYPDLVPYIEMVSNEVSNESKEEFEFTVCPGLSISIS